MSDKKRDSAAKAWCFTSYEEEKPVYDSDTHGYLVFQREKCPTTGRLHWQGYCEFKLKRRLTSIKKLPGFHKTAHWEKRIASGDEASGYCLKEESRILPPEEFGVRSRNGVKRTFDEAVAMVVSDPVNGIARVVDELPVIYSRWYRGLEALAAAKRVRPKWRVPEVTWIWGASGVGKTKMANDESDAAGLSVSGCSFTQLLENRLPYRGEDVLLVDDVCLIPNDVQRNQLIDKLLPLLDGYRYNIRVLYGYQLNVFSRVYLTANVHPDDVFTLGGPINQERVASVMRRIGRIVHLSAPASV